MVKNKNDKRYVRSKRGLEAGYYEEIRSQSGAIGVQARGIYRRAKVHSTTFMRHYGDLKGMSRSIRLEIKREYIGAMRKIEKSGGGLRDVTIMTFSFIKKHEDYFVTAATINNTLMLEWIGRKIWKRIRKTKYKFGLRRMEDAYVYELMGILTFWIRREKCDLDKTEQYVKYVMLISQEGMSRLGFLADKE
ncbi:hypothetical protein IJ096_01370 [Candidatus Saccharibacteria bacterium]|nr:hypothetical protein [Candidatus Saccharibacteria bacterium]